MQSKCGYGFVGMVLAAGMACASSAFADPTADALARIEAETLVLKARERQLTVQAQIAALQAEIASLRPMNARGRHAAASRPVIRGIDGIGRTVYATLMLEGGNVIEVKAGDVLPNGMRIVSVQANGVIVDTPNRGRIHLVAGEPKTAVAKPLAAPLMP
jgi:type IV pilus biogenesis protein PilP